MRLVLRADIDGVGKKGDIVDVADGYGRNYLVPRGHAFEASKGVVSQAAAMRRGRDLKDAKDRAAAETVARELVAKVITVKATRVDRRQASVLWSTDGDIDRIDHKPTNIPTSAWLLGPRRLLKPVYWPAFAGQSPARSDGSLFRCRRAVRRSRQSLQICRNPAQCC